MFKLKPLLLATAVAATGVIAWADATNPAVIARQQAMKMNGMAMKTLGDMAKGATGFDAGAANAAIATIAKEAGMIPSLFEANETDPESSALPAIWDNWDDFTAKAMALETAAKTTTVTDAASLGAAMGAIGGTCGACHKAYKSQ